MHHIHMVLRFKTQITAQHRGNRGFVLYSEQKLRHSYNQFGLRVILKNWKMI